MSFLEAQLIISDYINNRRPVNKRRFLLALIMARQSLRFSQHLEQRLQRGN